jgi:hypothetical protein
MLMGPFLFGVAVRMAAEDEEGVPVPPLGYAEKDDPLEGGA